MLVSGDAVSQPGNEGKTVSFSYWEADVSVSFKYWVL